MEIPPSNSQFAGSIRPNRHISDTSRLLAGQDAVGLFPLNLYRITTATISVFCPSFPMRQLISPTLLNCENGTVCQRFVYELAAIVDGYVHVDELAPETIQRRAICRTKKFLRGTTAGGLNEANGNSSFHCAK